PLLTEVSDAIDRLAATGRVVAFSLSSWNPELPGAQQAAAACAHLAAPFIGGIQSGGATRPTAFTG
ncbi:MAG: hypothetical protein ACR2NG_04400, partial [Acidimicrobiia bacterium]